MNKSKKILAKGLSDGELVRKYESGKINLKKALTNKFYIEAMGVDYLAAIRQLRENIELHINVLKSTLIGVSYLKK